MNLDTLSYMRNVKNATSKVLQSNESGSWALIGYIMPSNQSANKLCLLPINVIQEGSVWIDLLQTLDEESITYAFVKLEDLTENGKYHRFLIHWIGEKVSENMKTECAPHLNEIRNILPEFDCLISSMYVKDIQMKVHDFLSQTLAVRTNDVLKKKLSKTTTLPQKSPAKEGKKERTKKTISPSESCHQLSNESTRRRETCYKSLPHYKVSIIGNGGAGKTSIYCSYRGGGVALTSPHEIQSTSELDRFKRHLKMGDKEMILDIWDTAGQEKYRSFASCWLRNAHVVLLVYDLTDEASYTAISSWLATAKQYAKIEAVFLLVGNKKDLETRRVVLEETASEFAEKNGLEYIECSGLTGYNITHVFDCVVRRVMIAFPDNPQFTFSFEESEIIRLSDSMLTRSSDSKKKCCSM